VAVVAGNILGEQFNREIDFGALSQIHYKDLEISGDHNKKNEPRKVVSKRRKVHAEH
jgi:hypothetical protein